MTLALRLAAIVVAIAGLIDPAIERQTRAPRSIEFRLPPSSDPQFASAAETRERIERAIASGITVGDSLRPIALVAVGDAPVPIDEERTPVFAVPVPESPGTSITALSVSPRTVRGQSVRITASIHATGLSGRASKIDLELRGVPIETVTHTWIRDDEVFEPQWSFAPPEAGLYRTRVRVSTTGARDAVADSVIAARDEALRVLVYEPRPSWPVTFVRRSLESDESFDVAATARTSRPAVTISAGSPRSLAEIAARPFDVVVVGGLESLSASDLDALDRFATVRGGTVLLLPDRQLPGAVLRRFDLRQPEEVLVEQRLAVEGSGPALQASEFLLFHAAPRIQSLAAVRYGSAPQPAIVNIDRGEGRVIVSGLLDAWRHRATEADDFGFFWRALVADAALAAPPRIDVSVQPPIARPGDDLRVVVSVRRTEFTSQTDLITVPSVAAALTGASGSAEPLRLWPGSRPGMFTARLRAPEFGRYTLTATIDGASSTVPLLVQDDVVHPATRSSASAAAAARATGGAVIADPDQLAREIERLDTAVQTTTTHPARSVWWMVLFSALLCAEWTLRRRAGLR
jgi:hypothetical protein